VIREAGRRGQDKINRMSQILLSRDASPEITDVLENSFAEMQKHYAENPKDARSLVGIGESKVHAGIPDSELAAWTMIASEMLNLDETLNK
jgi:hypothetical protein